MKYPLVLVADPAGTHPFDLKRVLSGRGPCELVVVVEPLPGAAVAAPSRPGGTPAPPGRDGTQGASAALEARARYRLRMQRGRDPGAETGHDPGAAVAALLQKVTAPFVVVANVGPATLPFLEALHADARGRAQIRLGVTGPRFDHEYNLARKLVLEGKLDYHEHSPALERVLHRRLELVIAAPRGPARRAPHDEPATPAVVAAAAAGGASKPAAPEGTGSPAANASEEKA